jgi:hypothetical protein
MSVHLLPTYEEFIDHLIEKATPQEILAFKPSEAAQAHARELLERNQEGSLTAEDQAELEQMLEFEQMMTVLKAKALAALRQNESRS